MGSEHVDKMRKQCEADLRRALDEELAKVEGDTRFLRDSVVVQNLMARAWLLGAEAAASLRER